MAIFSVAQTNKEDQIVADTNWEQESYREGCAYPREQARVRLKALDDELLRRKPKGWTVLGVRERTMVTRFGEVVIRRRIYRDQDGQSRIALDEHLSWESHRQASPTLTESSVSIASAVPFRMVDEMVSALTAGVLSTSTVYRLLRDVGHRAIDDERSRRRHRSDPRGTDLAPQKHREVVSKPRMSEWPEASVPALSGPHSYRPWAHSLRNLIQPPLLLN